MRITKVRIRNFRSFDADSPTIHIPNLLHPISIIGPNNAGKTNLLDAIAKALLAIPAGPTTFSSDDFHLRNADDKIEINVLIDPPLMSTNAYNTISPMPVIELHVETKDGELDVKHVFANEQGKQIFNVRSVKRSRNVNFTDEQKEVLEAYQKSGVESVFKWRDKIPAYYIHHGTIMDQLRINRYTLLGKVLEKIRLRFGELDNKLPRPEIGLFSPLEGKPRYEVFRLVSDFLENVVLSTAELDSLINSVSKTLLSQLQIKDEDFNVRFGIPSAEELFKNLQFQVTDAQSKPHMPVSSMGQGFVSLFVVALFRAILDSDTTGGNIFLIEEPETYLHEHFQEYYYRVLLELSIRNQVIYTTHSKKFVDVFEPRSIISLRNVSNMQTEIVQSPSTGIEFPTVIGDFELHNPEDFPRYLRSLEPNVGNIAFANKVIIVEGPHDVLAYKTVLDPVFNLSLNNISIVAAWGKDPIPFLVSFCQTFKISCFVVHDWDIDSYDLSWLQRNAEMPTSLEPGEKQQLTKNRKIYFLLDAQHIHHNVRNLETVLSIADKGAPSVFERVSGRSLQEIQSQFPGFLPSSLVDFVRT